MDIATGGAIIAVVVALLTFLSTQLTLGRTADRERVGDMERRLSRTESDLKNCLTAKGEMEGELRRLRDENIVLMRTAMGLTPLVDTPEKVSDVY